MKLNFFKSVLLLSVLFILAGCSAPAASTPTLDPKMVYTQVAQTVAAQITNAAKLTPKATFTPMPSETPAPTLTPKATNATIVALTGTAKPGTAVATSATAITIATLVPTSSGALPPIPDKMEYISQSIADNTKFSPGQTFTMNWTIKNIGTTTWDTNYRVRFFGGVRCGAADDAIGGTVKPNDTYEVSMKMTTPTTPGSYSSLWVITNPDGRNFGSFYLVFEVK